MRLLRRGIRIAALALAAGAVPMPASAQSGAPGEPDTSKPLVRVGRLYLNPTVALTNLGVDTNVFNEPDQSAPKSDFTLTVTPQTDLWLRMGHSRLTGNVREDLVWYQTFASERAANSSLRLGWVVPVNRLAFNVNTDYLDTHDRPGFEIDARSQRTEFGYGGGVEIRARPKTFVGIRADRRTFGFDSVATFEGVSLREALNRTVTRERRSSSAFTITAVMLAPRAGPVRVLAAARLRLRRCPSVSSSIRSRSSKGSAAFSYRDFQPISVDLPLQTAAADLS